MPRQHCVRIGPFLLLLFVFPWGAHAQKTSGLKVSLTATRVQTAKHDGRASRAGIDVGFERHSGNDIRRISIGFTPATDHTPRLAQVRTGFGAYRTLGIVTAGARLHTGVLHTNADAMTKTRSACLETPCQLPKYSYETGWSVLLGAAAEVRLAIAQRLAWVGTIGMQSLVLGSYRGESLWEFTGGVAYRF